MRKSGAGCDRRGRRQLVGSLFLAAMGGEPPAHPHRRTEMARLAERSLPNTPFSLYPDEPDRSWQPPPGKRRGEADQYDNGNPVTPEEPESLPVRRRTPKQALSHLDNAAQAVKEESPFRFSRQRCKQPPFEKPEESVSRPRSAPSPLKRSHLSLGSLSPVEEPPKERLIPPPMVKKPLRTGRRHTPAPRSASAKERRIGIRMVSPPHHWDTAANRHESHFIFGVDAYESPDVKYRNQSNWSVGYASSDSTKLSQKSSYNGNMKRYKGQESINHPQEIIRRGRGRSATPRRREYNIISLMPY
ncbi:uncharacterized protein TM35_000072960 [Trypanosoma theileri]|uniref:Uncharacterized protein n=1 Tax=Trypanosoma theileri TaxID=67003 RepID=A0A1X0P1U3_9TRYP|nr:uncharacterized protein TM35_000072960 [Trypanosoma theileri]ORC90872.1 hypothetical protein TM35_000072960 [Trypanosoma theileri]